MLISIRPRFVDRILDGSKTVELRRSRPLVLPGQPVLIYATSPTAAIVARCRIGSVETNSPEGMWSRHRDRVGVDRAEFDGYYADAKLAVALHLMDVERLLHPVTLRNLRRAGRFHPPQTWQFFSAEAAVMLLGDENLDEQQGRTTRRAERLLERL